MRLARISLATKYRILFGIAVVLIIGAALAVPWYRMELLVLEQSFQAAQRIVADYFRLVMPERGAVLGGSGSPHGQEFALSPEKQDYQPRFVPLGATPDDPDSREVRLAAGIADQDELTVDIEADDQPRTVTLPPELAEAFATAPDAQAYYDGLAFTHRREYAEWVGSAKKPETRARRAGDAITRLRAGRRDPTGSR